MSKTNLVIPVLFLLSASGHAASPASGMLSPDTPNLTYSSGPFTASNASSQADANKPACDASNPCDDFALTVDVPASYISTHPHAKLQVSSTGFNLYVGETYYVYLLDAAGKTVIANTNGDGVVTLGAQDSSGSYTVRIVPNTANGSTLTTVVSLLAGDPPPAAAGLPPRYINQESPQPVGNNGQGEFNIGFNPKTHRIMTLGQVQTLRLTPPEYLTPPLPEACDALWEDVSDPATNANSNDPILVTDQQTGRTFVSQLILGAAGQSVAVYTDDDGASYTRIPATLDGSVDHQTIASGPYSKTGTARPSGSYPNAVYYCSQNVKVDTCIRSDDGGLTFGPPSVLFDNQTPGSCPGEFSGQHGHIRIAPDGTAYVPRRRCNGNQVVAVSEDSGDSWQVRHVPQSIGNGQLDPSIALASDGTGYFCYVNQGGDVHVAVTHDKGKSWINDADVGASQGVFQTNFPEAIAGDPDRAACGFIGTDTPGSTQSLDFPGVWYLYIATTYDGGKTWHTVKADPNDPVQGAGGVCTNGTTCGANRNMLDFNEITLDDQGRVLYGYDDGCIGGCVLDPTRINRVAKSAVLRQSGGRTLFAAFDPVEPAAPKAACLAGTRALTSATLNWRAPDSGGAAIASYRIFRGASEGAEVLVGETDAATQYKDLTADPNVPELFYKITAVNKSGEGIFSNTITLPVGVDAPLEDPCTLPGITIASDGKGDSTTKQDSTDLIKVSAAEPAEMEGKLVITLKVVSLAPQPPPNFRWMANVGAPNGTIYFVSMSTENGIPIFTYGTTGSDPSGTAGTLQTQGNLEPGSKFDADGTITLILDKSKIGAPVTGDFINIAGQVRATTPGQAGVAGAKVDDAASNSYTLRGACAAKTAPAPVLTPVVKPSRFGGALDATLLLFLFSLSLWERVRVRGRAQRGFSSGGWFSTAIRALTRRFAAASPRGRGKQMRHHTQIGKPN